MTATMVCNWFRCGSSKLVRLTAECASGKLDYRPKQWLPLAYSALGAQRLGRYTSRLPPKCQQPPPLRLSRAVGIVTVTRSRLVYEPDGIFTISVHFFLKAIKSIVHETEYALGWINLCLACFLNERLDHRWALWRRVSGLPQKETGKRRAAYVASAFLGTERIQPT